jgi:hypothetical protein
MGALSWAVLKREIRGKQSKVSESLHLLWHLHWDHDPARGGFLERGADSTGRVVDSLQVLDPASSGLVRGCASRVIS